jgi:nucleotide-binding universal stress UspA family protein
MKILLPIDHSAFSQQALRSVASLVRPKGNQVRVLHVIEHPAAYFSAAMIPRVVKHTARVERDRLAEALVLVNRAAAKLRRAGLEAEGLVESGNAGSVILDHANKWGADLIVVGSHGLRGLRRVLMGSVSAAVIRDAKCSVQVVRIRKVRSRAVPKPKSKPRR